jgi:hypothetical protein
LPSKALQSAGRWKRRKVYGYARKKGQDDKGLEEKGRKEVTPHQHLGNCRKARSNANEKALAAENPPEIEDTKAPQACPFI